MNRYAVPVATLALLLSACGDKTPAPVSEDDQRKARGEVLGGSISDDMIKLDTLTSKSPPLKVEPKAAATSGSGSGAATPAPETTQPAELDVPATAEAAPEN